LAPAAISASHGGPIFVNYDGFGNIAASVGGGTIALSVPKASWWRPPLRIGRGPPTHGRQCDHRGMCRRMRAVASVRVRQVPQRRGARLRFVRKSRSAACCGQTRARNSQQPHGSFPMCGSSESFRQGSPVTPLWWKGAERLESRRLTWLRIRPGSPTCERPHRRTGGPKQAGQSRGQVDCRCPVEEGSHHRHRKISDGEARRHRTRATQIHSAHHAKGVGISAQRPYREFPGAQGRACSVEGRRLDAIPTPRCGPLLRHTWTPDVAPEEAMARRIWDGCEEARAAPSLFKCRP